MIFVASLNMNPHYFAVFACGTCGILMVLGAIWLLKTGAITLSDAAKDGTLSIEIASKVKVSTTYPALALFIIGLSFAALSLWFSQGDIPIVKPFKPLAIVGQIQGIGIEDENLVTVTVQPDQYGSAVSFGASSNGQLDKILPDIKQFTVMITANGYLPQPYKTTLNVDDAVEDSQRRRLNVPDVVKFTKLQSGPVTVAAPPVPGRIDPTPAGTKLEPLRVAATEPSPSQP